MAQIEKTIFISYSRDNKYIARAVFQNLTAAGYDVFLDYETINSGDFEQVIYQSIESRAHFILILTPSVVTKCKNPKNWIRREIEHALKMRRNIIPITFDAFEFASLGRELPEHLSTPLSKYNGLRIPAEYFDEAMKRLHKRYLNIPLDLVLHPVSDYVNKAEKRIQIRTSKAPKVTNNQVKAEEVLEKISKFSLNGMGKGKIREDIRLANMAMNLDPNSVHAYTLRGSLYAEIGQYRKAIDDIKKAKTIDPRNRRIPHVQGIIFNHLKEYDKALAAYDRAIKLDPQYAVSYNNKGVIFNTLEKYHEAIEQYSAAIVVDPQYALAYSNRGSVYRILNKEELALEDLNKAIALDPSYAGGYHNRGLLYKGRGIAHNDRNDINVAITDFTKAIEVESSWSQPYIERALCFSSTNLNAALNDLEKAIEINPEDTYPRSLRAAFYLDHEKYKKAKPYVEELLAINPDDEIAKEMMQEIKRKTGWFSGLFGS